jgi:hypothetical protein
MTVLVIGTKERERIKEIIEHARTHVIPLALIKQAIPADKMPNDLTLADREGHENLVRPPSAHVMFPGGIRAAFSIEMQPPPVELCSHLSISAPMPGRMPSVPAVKMICEEFGVPFPPDVMGWNEEFDPGHFAVNLLSVWRDTSTRPQ